MEPVYAHGIQYRPGRPQQETIYHGDDFGGHNIPFPHPKPPMPHKMYDRHAFVQIDKFVKGECDKNGIDIHSGTHTLDLHGFGSYRGHGFGDIQFMLDAIEGIHGPSAYD